MQKMKKCNRFLSGLLALILCLSVVSPTVLAAEEPAAQPGLVFTGNANEWAPTEEAKDRVYLNAADGMAIDAFEALTITGSEKDAAERYELDAHGYLTLKEGAAAKNGETITISTAVDYYTEDQLLWTDGLEKDNSLIPSAAGMYCLNHSDLNPRTGLKSGTTTDKNVKDGMWSKDIKNTGHLVFWYYDPFTAEETDQKALAARQDKNGNPGAFDQVKFGMAINGYSNLLLGMAIPTASEVKDLTERMSYAATYTYRVNSAWLRSNIERSEGWHKMEIDVTAAGSTMKIDGKDVCPFGSTEPVVATNVKSIDKAAVATNWGNKSEMVEFVNGKHFIDDMYILKSDAGEAKNAELSLTVTVKNADDEADQSSVDAVARFAPLFIKMQAVAQADAETAAAAVALAQAQVDAASAFLAQCEKYGVSYVLDEGTFTAAVKGTREDPKGTDGSYVFTLTLTKNNAVAETGEITLPITAEAFVVMEETLTFGADNTGVLKKGETGRVFLDNMNDYAIAGVKYAVDNANVQVSEDGTLTLKDGYSPKEGDTVTVTAEVSYYDPADVIFADSFEGEKQFTDADAGVYVHSDKGSLFGRHAATAQGSTTGYPKLNLSATDVTVTAWYYDANGGADQTKFGFGINGGGTALGIFYDGAIAPLVNDMTKTHYGARVNGYTYNNYGWGTTDIARSKGWHKFEWIIDSEKGLTEKIDDQVISTNTKVGNGITDHNLVKVENYEKIKELTEIRIMDGWSNNGTNLGEISHRHFIDGVTVVKNGAAVKTMKLTSVAIPVKGLEFSVEPESFEVDSTYPSDQSLLLAPYVAGDSDVAQVKIDDKVIDLWTAGQKEAPLNASFYPAELKGYELVVLADAFQGIAVGEHTLTIVTKDGSEIKVPFTAHENTHTPTNYYLSQDGNDEADGHSEQTAWKSFEKLETVTFGPGDHIYLDAQSVWSGVQFRPKGSGAPGAPIVLTKYNAKDDSQRPVLNGDGTVADKTDYKYLAFDAWRNFYPSGTLELFGVEYWEVSDLEITNYSAQHDAENGSTGRNGIAIIYDFYEMGPKKLTSLPSGNDALEQEFYRAGKLQHVYVTNCYIHDVNGRHPGNGAKGAGSKMSGGINAYGPYDDLKLDGNIVMYCDVEGIRNDVLAWRGDTRTQFPAYMEGISISNNYIVGVPGDGVVISSADRPVLQNNYLSDAGYSYYVGEGAAARPMGNRQSPKTMGATNFAGLWFIGTKDAVAQYNESVNNVWVCQDGEAFDADMYCWGTVFQYNYTYRNNGGFCLFMSSMDKGTIVRYNVSVEDGEGVGSAGGKKATFYYNGTPEAIYNNLFVLGNGIRSMFGGDSNTTHFYNNIVVKPDGQIGGFHLNGNGSSDTTAPDLSGEIQNNLFYPAEILNNVTGSVKKENNLTPDTLNGVFQDLNGFLAAQPVKALLGRSELTGSEVTMESGKGAGVAMSADAGKAVKAPTGGFDLNVFSGIQLAEGSPAIGAGIAMPRAYEYKAQTDKVLPLTEDFFKNDISKQKTFDIGPHQASAESLVETDMDLVFSAEELVKGESGRVYLEGIEDTAIESVTYSVSAEDAKKVDVDPLTGELTIKEGVTIGENEKINVIATVTFYDNSDDKVLFVDNFVAEQRMDNQGNYKHSDVKALFGATSCTPWSDSKQDYGINWEPKELLVPTADKTYTVSGWIYGPALSSATDEKFAFGVNQFGNTGNKGTNVGIIHTSPSSLASPSSNGYYGEFVTRGSDNVSGTTSLWYRTNVARTEGWHRIVYTVTPEGTTADLYVNGTEKHELNLMKPADNGEFAEGRVDTGTKAIKQVKVWCNWARQGQNNPGAVVNKFFADGVFVIETGAKTAKTVLSTEVALKGATYKVTPATFDVDSTYPTEQVLTIAPYVAGDTDVAKVLIDGKEISAENWSAALVEAPRNVTASNYPEGYKLTVAPEAFKGLTDGNHTLVIVTKDGAKLEVPFTAHKNTHVATDYYLSNNDGSDSNDGHTAATAWKSFEKLQSVTFGPGDRIFLDAKSSWSGVQFRPEGSGAPGAPITLTKYNFTNASERPILNGDGTVADLEAHSYLAFDPWRAFYPSGTVELINVEHWEISGLEITNYTKEMQKGATGRNGIAVIHDFFETQGVDTLPSGTDAMEKIYYNAGKLDHIFIEDCYIHDVVGYHPINGAVGRGGKMSGGINVYGPFDDLKLEKNIVMYCDVEGIRNDVLAWETDNRTQFPPIMENVSISNNFIAGVPGDGVVISCAVEPKLENNYLTDAGYSYYATSNSKNTGSTDWNADNLASCRDVAAKTGAVAKEMGNRQDPMIMGATNFAGLWFIGTQDAVAQYNEAVNNVWVCNDSEAFDADMFCQGTIFQYNYTYRNNGGFCLFMGGTLKMDEGTLVRYNVSVEDAQSIGISESQNGTFHYNRAPEAIHNNLFILGDKVATMFGGGANDTYFYNNIVIAPKGLLQTGAYNGYHFNGSSDGDIKNPQLSGEVKNNIFYPAAIVDSIVAGSSVKLEDNIVLKNEEELKSVFVDLDGFLAAQPVKALLGRSDMTGDPVHMVEGKGAGVAMSADAGRQVTAPTGGFDYKQFAGIKLAKNSPAIGAGTTVMRNYAYKAQNDAVNPLTEDFFKNKLTNLSVMDIGPHQYSSEGYVEPTTLRVGTFNAQGNKNPYMPDRAKFLDDNGIEVVGLQEVDKNTNRTPQDMLAELVKAGKMTDSHFQKAIDLPGGEYGNGIASVYPLTEKSGGPLDSEGGGEARAYVRAVVEIDGKEVAIYNTHLCWNEDVNAAMAVRARQIKQLKEMVLADEVEYKVIVGDFNVDQDHAEWYEFLTDLNMANGGEGVWYDTYNGVDPTMKVEEVDNILTTRNIQVDNVTMVETKLSDHNLFYADLTLLDEYVPSKQLLNFVISDAKELDGKDYSDESFQDLQDAIDAGESLGDDATQAEIDKAIEDIKNAIDALQPPHTHVFDQKNTDAKYLKSAATCTEPAVYYYSCACGEKGTETFTYGEAAGHKTEVKNAKEATCEEAGYTGDEICSVCGDTIKKGEEIPALGHTGGEATCCHEAVCERCGKPYGEVDPENHEGPFENVGQKAPTTETEGYSGDFTCLGCGTVIAEGHVIDKLPTEPTDPEKPENPFIPNRPNKPVKPVGPTAPEFPFTDVHENDWFYEEVKSAWENDLVDGVSADKYAPNETLTVASAIKLAAALHQMDNDGYVSLKNGAPVWYSTYVDYAVENGVIEESYLNYTAAQMNAPVTRAEFIHIFYGAMDNYDEINDVKDDHIPDVKMTDKYADEIYTFYRAGILTGCDSKGSCRPATVITRGEVAAILIRMYDVTARVRITL